VTLDQRHGLTLGCLVPETDCTPFTAPLAFESRFLALFDKVIMLAAIGDEVADRADLQSMLAGELDQVREAGHRPVLVHDLADHAGRVEPGKT